MLPFFCSRFVMPMFVEYQIFTNLPLVEGEEAFEAWKRPPVTPTMSLYVFNFTNTQAFLAGKLRFLLLSYSVMRSARSDLNTFLQVMKSRS